MANYSLRLYKSVHSGGTAFVNEITRMAWDWTRSIRFQGGYWTGSFSIIDEPLSVLQDFYYTQLGSHLIEYSGAAQTWEGMIYEMDLIDDLAAPELRVRACGYVFTLNWRFVSTTSADSTTGNASTYISDILTNDCDFDANTRIDTNTLQVYRSTPINQRAFDEILRITEMGDGSGNIWRFYLDNDRRAVYEQFDTTPRYQIRGGGIRRRSLDAMYNHISGNYIDSSDEAQTLAAGTVATSITRYGQREEKLVELHQDQAAMEALRDTYLAENSWPWPRPVGSTPGVQIYDNATYNLIQSPWQIRPAVVRDIHYPVSGSETGSSLSDPRDFIIDEIEVDATGSVMFRTPLFEDADMLETQYMMEQPEEESEAGGASGGGSSSKSRLNWKRKLGLKPGTPEWERAAKASWAEKQKMIAAWKAKKKKKG